MKKIPTAAEVAARRANINEQKAEEKVLEQMRIETAKQELLNVLFDRSLCFGVVSALAVEYHDDILPTTHYSKQYKMHGNKAIEHNLKVTETLYADMYKQDALYTHNFTQVFDRVIKKLAQVNFVDWPLIEEMLDQFIADKVYWRSNIVATFNRLDVDGKQIMKVEDGEMDVVK
jgi:hypothetical protein